MLAIFPWNFWLDGQSLTTCSVWAGYKEVETALQEMGASLASLEEIEDAALGNGGLGRLAACFLDSAATPESAAGRLWHSSKYGLFKQSIVDGFQKEEPDNWMQYGDAWSVRCEKDAVLVHFNGQTVKLGCSV